MKLERRLCPSTGNASDRRKKVRFPSYSGRSCPRGHATASRKVPLVEGKNGVRTLKWKGKKGTVVQDWKKRGYTSHERKREEKMGKIPKAWRGFEDTSERRDAPREEPSFLRSSAPQKSAMGPRNVQEEKGNFLSTTEPKRDGGAQRSEKNL